MDGLHEASAPEMDAVHVHNEPRMTSKIDQLRIKKLPERSQTEMVSLGCCEKNEIFDAFNPRYFFGR